MSNRSERSHTKAGPGRYHGQGALITHEDKRYVRQSRRRFPVAIHGGNWQGVPYNSYRELDRVYQLMQRSFMTRVDATAAMLAERKAAG